MRSQTMCPRHRSAGGSVTHQRMAEAQRVKLEHCGKPMETWRNSIWDESTRRLKWVRFYRCLECGKKEQNNER